MKDRNNNDDVNNTRISTTYSSKNLEVNQTSNEYFNYSNKRSIIDDFNSIKKENTLSINNDLHNSKFKSLSRNLSNNNASNNKLNLNTIKEETDYYSLYNKLLSDHLNQKKHYDTEILSKDQIIFDLQKNIHSQSELSNFNQNTEPNFDTNQLYLNLLEKYKILKEKYYSVKQSHVELKET